MGEKSTNIIYDIDDAGLFIENRDGSGAQAQTADFAWSREIQRRIKLCFCHDTHTDATGDCSLRFASLPHAAAMFVYQLAQGDAEGQFHATRLIDVAADAIKFRPIAADVARVLWVRRHAYRFEPIGATIYDVRDACYRLDIVHDRWFAEGPFHSRKRRLDARPTALAFQTFD